MSYTINYSEIKKIKPLGWRGKLRDLALTGMSLETFLPSAEAAFLKPRVQFLYIHHVFDDELQAFENLLKALSKHHTFISYGNAVKKILSNEIDKPYICISSDDGFKNNLKAAEIMDRFGAKGCFFVNPDSIGLKNHGDIQNFCKSRLSFPPTEFMDWDDVNTLLKKGHEVGSHTMGHINVAQTELSRLEDNLNQSYQLIKNNCGVVEHFAYPYGRFFHFNLAAFELSFKAGYTSCATAERGCHVTNQAIAHNKLLIRRDHVVCDWNLHHILYFILKASKNASYKNNFNPYQS